MNNLLGMMKHCMEPKTHWMMNDLLVLERRWIAIFLESLMSYFLVVRVDINAMRWWRFKSKSIAYILSLSLSLSWVPNFVRLIMEADGWFIRVHLSYKFKIQLIYTWIDWIYFQCRNNHGQFIKIGGFEPSHSVFYFLYFFAIPGHEDK